MSGNGNLLRKRIFALFLVVVLAGGALFALRVYDTQTKAGQTKQEVFPYDTTGLGEVEAAVTKQDEVDAGLMQALQSGDYTLEEPYVQLDPYGESPLTAIAVFTTDTPAKISVHVQGDTPKADVDFTFDDYETGHAVPILGLYPDRTNTVTLTAAAQDGTETETVLEIATEALPDFFNGFNLITAMMDEQAYMEGLNFPSMCQACINYPFAFDCNGVVRWYLPNYNNVDMGFFFFREGEEGFIIGQGDSLGDISFTVINVLGKVFDYYYAAYGSHHDLYQTDYNSWIITGNDPYNGGATVEDVIYEMSTTDGSILHVLDFKTILERTRNFSANEHDQDWLHLNSVVEYQGDVIVSSYYQSLVMRTGWDGQIRWILSDPAEYLEMYDQYMLTPIGDDFKWCYNQHAIQLLPDQDGNEDTVDIMIFDNGSDRNVKNGIVEDSYSRLVQYRIDETNMTIKQVWAYGEDRTELFAAGRSDANLLENGNVLGTFSITALSSAHGVYLEVNRAGELIWECLAQSVLVDNTYIPYRCERMNIYTENIKNLHLGEEPGIYVPDEIWEKYGITPVTTGTTVDEATETAVPATPATAATAEEPGDQTTALAWNVAVESAALLPALHTETEVQQYEGDYKTVTYDNTPSAGMQFALLDLTVTKTQKTKSSFDWANLTLVLADGSAYARAADTYLSDHGYTRISGTKLSLSTAAGYACFEIPENAELTGAVLRYAQDEGTATFVLP